MARLQDMVELERLYARHGQRLYNYLFWLTYQPEAAERLTEGSFLRFAGLRRTEVEGPRARPALYRLATRLAQGWERQRQWRERLPFGRSRPQLGPEGEEPQLSREDAGFRTALQSIPLRSRAALLLREMEQMPLEQMEQVLGLSASGLRRRLFNAREEIGLALIHPTVDSRECRQAWMLLSASRDGALALPEQERLRAHLEACPWCAERARDYDILTRRFQSLPPRTAPSELRDQIFSRPTALATPWFVPSMELMVAGIIGAGLVAVGITIGSAVWQSGLLAALFDRPFSGPAVYVANAGEKGSISVVAAKGERVVAQVPLGAQPRSLALSPDLKTLYAAHDLGISLLDTKTNAVTATIQVPGGAQRVLVHPSTGHIYAISAARGPVAGRVWVYDGKSRARLDQAVAGMDPYDAALSPDGRRLFVVGGRETSITVIPTANLGDGTTLRLAQPGYDYSLVSNPNNRTLYAIDRRRSTVTLVDTSDMSAQTASFPLGKAREASSGPRPNLAAAGGAALSPDGQRLYVALVPPDEGLGIFALDRFSPLARIAHRASGVAAGPEAVYVTSAPDGTMLVTDPATQKVLSTVQVGDSPYAVVYKP